MSRRYAFFTRCNWLLGLLVLLLAPVLTRAQPVVLPGPVGSGAFGSFPNMLPNGNYVVADPDYSTGGLRSVGAVYLYDGRTNGLISTLTGTQTNDRVGSGGILTLANGNYVVLSASWANGAARNAGAATWGSSSSGVSGVVSAANSLVGSQTNDSVGSMITALTSGNYLVNSPNWANGAAAQAGAVTWGSGTSGVRGAVSTANSLVGSQATDQVGTGGIYQLANGHYVVSSFSWSRGAGAVTWGNGTTGVSGVVSAANSLVGSQPSDQIGRYNITPLTNGNYVVGSSNWANGTATYAGAVTWGNGTTGVSGVVSAANSLVGTQPNDLVGNTGITALTNGNYVVGSSSWGNGSWQLGAATWGSGTSGVRGVITTANSLVGTQDGDQVGTSCRALTNGNYVVHSRWANGTAAFAGAATWGDGTSGIRGVVSAANSLVGTQPSDLVGGYGITALANGNYVVHSAAWANGAATFAGAATWGDGTSGIAGPVSAANSLVGSQANDKVGSQVLALTNGHYVVGSEWTNGTVAQVGAVTWCNGTSGRTGAVSAANSLIGSQAGDKVANAVALTNGNYVAYSFDWANGAAPRAGAATWCNGATGLVGVVSATNSLVGTQANDQVSGGAILTLPNGNYVVRSQTWGNGPAAQAGAVTWGSGTSGVNGVVSAANSLVGTQPYDLVGANLLALPDNNYLVRSIYWANGSVREAGALTLGNGDGGTVGLITGCNSLLGSTTHAGSPLFYAYRASTGTLLGGLPTENKIQLGVGAPPAPTGVAAQGVAVGATVASLTATGTAIQWYAVATGGSPLALTTLLASDSTYYASQMVAGCESRTRLAVTVSQPLATAPAALAQQLACYPNPAAGAVFVTLPASLGRQAVAATLVDAVGRPLRTFTLPAQGIAAHSLDLRELPIGVYLLRLDTSAGTLVRKLAVE